MKTAESTSLSVKGITLSKAYLSLAKEPLYSDRLQMIKIKIKHWHIFSPHSTFSELYDSYIHS